MEINWATGIQFPRWVYLSEFRRVANGYLSILYDIKDDPKFFLELSKAYDNWMETVEIIDDSPKIEDFMNTTELDSLIARSKVNERKRSWLGRLFNW